MPKLVFHSHRPPAVFAFQGHKYHGDNRLVIQSSIHALPDLQFLFLARANGYHQTGALGKLVEQWLRRAGRGGGDDNSLIRGVFRPAG